MVCPMGHGKYYGSDHGCKNRTAITAHQALMEKNPENQFFRTTLDQHGGKHDQEGNGPEGNEGNANITMEHGHNGTQQIRAKADTQTNSKQFRSIALGLRSQSFQNGTVAVMAPSSPKPVL